MEPDKISALILAAGKGTRMKSDLPKVLHSLLGRPLLGHVLEIVRGLGILDIVAVIGHGRALVEEFLKEERVKAAVQEQQLGTGHAVACALPQIDPDVQSVLILCGDTPLFKTSTLRALLDGHEEQGCDISVLSSRFSDPTGYGRIVRDNEGRLKAIVEQKDASIKELSIKEINSGTYVVRRTVLEELLPSIKNENAQGEYYLTDIVALGLSKGLKVEAFPLADEEETLGVNSRAQLSQAEEILLQRRRRRLMDEGVTLMMAHTIYVEPGVEIERDVTIEPYCMLNGEAFIGKGARIGAGSILTDVVIPSDTAVEPGSIIRG